MRILNHLFAGVLVLAFSSALAAQVSFEKVEIRTGFGQAREGDKGRLAFDAKGIRFIDESWNEFVSIPAGSVTKLYYSSVEGARPGSPLSRPFELLQGKKHFFVVTFAVGDLPAAVEFKLHKSNYEGVLKNAELVTGKTVELPEPEVRVSDATPAPQAPPKEGVLRITSSPELAEVEINNAFNGLTPRGKAVTPGQYSITVSKEGYKQWKREVLVDPGTTLEIHADLLEETASND
ncbi:MAG: PEGA domain-containing protein [Acidobacteria bacterium]|nr:PEGA domain-containing protein [Acidobacteriota bacterium]MDA1235413.1 PEGA domain-containing protein [Acidobacteriota bacterium]